MPERIEKYTKDQLIALVFENSAALYSISVSSRSFAELARLMCRNDLKADESISAAMYFLEQAWANVDQCRDAYKDTDWLLSRLAACTSVIRTYEEMLRLIETTECQS